MKDKIIEIVSNIHLSDQEVADKILALGWYPKEFVEWMFHYEYTMHYDKYLTVADEVPTNKMLDELYEYWKNLPK